MKLIILMIYALVFQNKNCFYFSVIISIYNTGRYLDDSIGSLLNQTIGSDKIQIVLVNDGSTDNSEKICIKYQRKFKKNINYIKIKHGGVSKARNIGLKYAKGLFINFLDSDDKWDSEAFKNIYLFFKLNKKIDIVGGRIRYFESRNNYHFLDYKFKSTRVVNLTNEYNCIQLSVSGSFFRFTSIKGKKFDENIFSGEDVRFISSILLIKPLIGFVREAIYYYRKRADSSSAIQNTEEKKDFYFSTITLVQQYLINKSISLFNKIVPFIQFYIAYETLFRIESLAFKFLDLKSYNEYCDIIVNLLKQIDEKYILEQKVFPSRLQMLALSKKYDRDVRYDIILKKECFLYSDYILMNLKYYQGIITWINLEIHNNNLHLIGEDRAWFPREKFFYFCKLGNKTFFPKYSFYSGFDFLTMFGIVNKGRIVTFDIKLEIKDQEILYFFISYMNKNIEISPSYQWYTHIPPTKNSYYTNENYIIKKNNNKLIILKKNNNLESSFENDYCIELQNLQKDYIIKLRKEHIEDTKKYKISEKKKIWLINDRKDQAGDNGEYFFRYLNNVNPKGINFFFVIEKNCSDYERFKSFENIIDLNSNDYLRIFLKADKIISSISESWVTNPFGIDGKYFIDLYHFDFIYLQNGIIKDDVSGYLNRYRKNFDLIITSSKREYNSILKGNYGYKKNNLILTGLPRFDSLQEIEKNIQKDKIILIFPTWRIYIKGTRDLITEKSIKSENFKNTDYFKFYNDLINNKLLLNNMEKNDYLGIFCLHPNFAEQYRFFTENNIFTVKEKCNQQELLAKSSLLVTDYNSIFFDFGYIKKPVIYAQFDYNQYRKSHFPKGYFDYEKDGFGPICYNMNCTIKTIISEIENNCKLKLLYFKRIKKFFRFFDTLNSFRTYICILKDKNKGESKDSIEINLYYFIPIIIAKIIFINFNKIINNKLIFEI